MTTPHLSKINNQDLINFLGWTDNNAFCPHCKKPNKFEVNRDFCIDEDHLVNFSCSWDDDTVSSIYDYTVLVYRPIINPYICFNLMFDSKEARVKTSSTDWVEFDFDFSSKFDKEFFIYMSKAILNFS